MPKKTEEEAEEIGFPFAFKRAEVEIEGITDLLMDMLDSKELITPPSPEELKNFEKRAAKSRYITGIDGKETLYIPARAVKACILRRARAYKAGKERMDYYLRGVMRIEPLCIPLVKDGGYIGAEDYEMDLRAVGFPTKKMKARAKVWPWGAKFYLVTGEELLRQQKKRLETIISEAGIKYGLLSFRPERGGDFGMFKLKSFKVLEE